MTEHTYSVIGLMSGTSLDGLDMAHCLFTKQGEKWLFSLEKSHSIVYPDSLRERLKKSVDLSSVELLLLNNEFGKWSGEHVRQFISHHGIKVDFVASHGHTVFHQPEKGLTYQIGAGQELANSCGERVVCDFRSLDVSLGGQGAPLVPVGDQSLFEEYDFCLNLGGIGNVSFDKDGVRVAYDIGPVNMLLNHLTTRVGKPYDKHGETARSGSLDENLLNQLNHLDYYQLPFPKSLGYEWFCDEVIPLIDKNPSGIPDKLCTATHHIAFQIFKGVTAYCEDLPARLLATGGGAKNDFLIEKLQQFVADRVKIVIPEPKIVDFKEAIVFAFMGVKRVRKEINCLKSVTGASADSSGGVVYYPG